MTTEQFNALFNFSNTLADLVEYSAQWVVAVQARRRRSSSGVLWRSDIVVTAEHAVNRDEEIRVTLPDDRTVTATLVGRDATTDLAVLRLAEPYLASAPIAAATNLKVGHFVVAIARSDNGVSASQGVISTLGGEWHSWQGGRIDQFIRPALNLYPGFSGSVLVNMQAQLVGMNTTGPRHTALTIPATTIDRVVNSLLSSGRIVRGYLGVGMQAVQFPATLQQTLNLPSDRGVIVVSVAPQSPAEQAGVLIGDVLIALENSPIQDVDDVHALLDPERIGQSLKAQVIRGGAVTEVAIVVGERPAKEG